MIKKIGIEVRGSWIHKPTGMRPNPHAGLDGYDGEIRKSSPNIHFLCAWLAKNYPDSVNELCEIHIHFSFTTLSDYILISRFDFYKFLQDRLYGWSEQNLAEGTRDYNIFMARMEGGNEYSESCENLFYPELQLYDNAEKFTQVNFRAYRDRGTIEIRVLPVFESARTAVSAVRAVYNAVSDYLRTARRTKPVARVFKLMIPETCACVGECE